MSEVEKAWEGPLPLAMENALMFARATLQVALMRARRPKTQTRAHRELERRLTHALEALGPCRLADYGVSDATIAQHMKTAQDT